MTQGPIELFKNGVQVFEGEASPAPGGGSIAKQENINGGSNSVAPGTPSVLTWQRDSGDALLDYTDPNAPTVVTAGTYAITTVVTVDAAAGKLAAGNLSPGSNTSIGVATALDDLLLFGAAQLGLTAVAKLGAGDSLQYELGHNAAGSLNCALVGYLVLLGP